MGRRTLHAVVEACYTLTQLKLQDVGGVNGSFPLLGMRWWVGE